MKIVFVPFDQPSEAAREDVTALLAEAFPNIQTWMVATTDHSVRRQGRSLPTAAGNHTLGRENPKIMPSAVDSV